MKYLEQKAKKLRRDVLRLSIKEGEAHLGGCFSEIELMVSLYHEVLKDKDKFILSKGHASFPQYILLKEKGYNPKISTHPDIDEKNGIYCTTGSLGHGLPIALGMAFARKLQKQKGDIYVLLGDGECQEGTTWESSLIASHYKLDNLISIVDKNNLQALDYTNDVLCLGNLKNKFKSFGWFVSEIDGHSFEEIISALRKREKGKPRMIIANTIKGKGISYMENDSKWHTRLPDQKELKQAYDELK